MAILCRGADLLTAAAAAVDPSNAVTVGQKPFLGFIDKLFQHHANVLIGLGGKQEAIALQAEAVGCGIVGGEALCHASWLTAGTGRRHLRAST